MFYKSTHIFSNIKIKTTKQLHINVETKFTIDIDLINIHIHIHTNIKLITSKYSGRV